MTQHWIKTLYCSNCDFHFSTEGLPFKETDAIGVHAHVFSCPKCNTKFFDCDDVPKAWLPDATDADVDEFFDSALSFLEGH